MRKEPFFVGDVIHVFNRGNRKQEIVRDEKDYVRITQMLYYFNDEYASTHVFRDISKLSKFDFDKGFYRGFERPEGWPKRDPLVKILAFIVLDNHYHFILKETREGGVTKFMRKFGTGVTNRFNTKYKETGKLFQGSYKARCIKDDNQLRYLAVYIMVKNAFEMYPGGIKNALKNFDDAYDFAVKYLYSSLSSYADDEISPIIDKDILENTFKNPEELKGFARDCIEFVYYDEKSSKVSFINN